LPLTASGKVDRKALPAPEQVQQEDYEPPQGEVEQALAQIWADILGVAGVGRHDDFFACGGHSLAVLRVQREVKRRLGAQLPLRAFFESSSLVAQARAVAEALQRSAVEEASDLEQMAELLDVLES
jgi:hypothetical protein